MLDPVTQRLYTVASSGYPTSGVGSEIAVGDGVIGVAARERTPVRITHMTSAHLYSQAVRGRLQADTPGLTLDVDIPYPGLLAPHSQLAVPVMSMGRLLGVLFVESPNDLQFSFEDEDALVAIAGHLGSAVDLIQSAPEGTDEAAAAAASSVRLAGSPLQIRRFPANDSIFINDAYLIKGVAGAIFWKLARESHERQRSEFSLRELRLAGSELRLPDVQDNLSTRLLLLQRRLCERHAAMQIHKAGRGRFRIELVRPLQLTRVSDPAQAWTASHLAPAERLIEHRADHLRIAEATRIAQGGIRREAPAAQMRQRVHQHGAELELGEGVVARELAEALDVDG